MSRIEEAIRLVLQFAEALNSHDVGKIREVMGDDCRYEPSDPVSEDNILIGSNVIADFWTHRFQEYPNFRIKIEEVFGLGKRCVLLWRREDSNNASDFQVLRGADIFHVRDGLICEQLSYIKGTYQSRELTQ